MQRRYSRFSLLSKFCWKNQHLNSRRREFVSRFFQYFFIESPGMSHPLIGVWHLLSCEHRMEDGSVWHPFGPKAQGRLIYTSDGFMMVMLMNPDRPQAASGQVFEATGAERAAAAEGFLAYSGRCELFDGRVVHHVDLSLFPNWLGSAQLRTFDLSGDTVTFKTRSFLARGRQQVASLSWRREPPAGRAP